MSVERVIKFTPSQQQAADHRSGNMVVLASAGSGKTASLTQRCVEILLDSEHPCPVDQLLVVTFTNEAAAEMRNRIHREMRRQAGQIDDPVKRRYARRQASLMDMAKIMTLHAFCHSLVRDNFALCGVDPAATLLDELESSLMLREAVRQTLSRWVADDDTANRPLINFYTYTCGARPERLFDVIQPLLRRIENSPDPEKYLKLAIQQNSPDQIPLHERWRSIRDRLDAHVDFLTHCIDQLAAVANSKTMIGNLRILLDHLAGFDSALNAGDETRVHELAPIEVPKVTKVMGPKTVDENEKAAFYAAKHDYYEVVKKKTADFIEDMPRILRYSEDARLAEECRYMADILRFVGDVRKQFTQMKAARHLLDFSDLEHKTLAALRNHSNGLLSAQRAAIRHLLVDEYQDINPVQEAIINLLAGDLAASTSGIARSRFMVGDVLQSIYAFRGAAPGLLYAHHKKAVEEKNYGRHVEMQENFRTIPALLESINAVLYPMLKMADEIVSPPSAPQDSDPPVVSAAAAPDDAQGTDCDVRVTPPDILRLADLPLPKAARRDPPLLGLQTGQYKLQLNIVSVPNKNGRHQDHADDRSDTSSDDSHGDSPTKTQSEARLVGRAIRQLIDQGGQVYRSDGPRRLQYSDIVILMRSPRSVAATFVRELRGMGIPTHAQLSSGFLDSPAVLETLSLLRVLDNLRQDIDLASTLVGMYGCMAINELQKLRLAASDRHMPLYAVIDEILQPSAQAKSPRLADDLRHRLADHMARLNRWRQLLQNRGIAAGMIAICEDAAIRPLLSGRMNGPTELANLDLLMARAARFAEDGSRGINRFLEFVEILADADEDMAAASVETGNSLRIMSIHASKGLEFPVVMLAGLGKRFNSDSANATLLPGGEGRICLKWISSSDRIRMQTDRYDDASDRICREMLQEEMRLLYVAMTRARDHLMLFGAAGESELARYQPWSKDFKLMAAATRSRLHSLTMLDIMAPVMLSLPPESGSAVQICPDANISASIGEAAPEPSAAAELPSSGAQGAADISEACRRVEFQYPWRTDVPATVSVSRLKERYLHSDESGSPITIPAIPDTDSAQTDDALTRGLSLHSFLQMVQLNALANAVADGNPQRAIRGLVQKLIETGAMSADAADHVDADDIVWFTQTDLWPKLLAAATAGRLFREQAVTWTMPAREIVEQLELGRGVVTPAGNDRVMVRGIIDALIDHDHQPIILDYKSDKAESVDRRLPAYREQVQLYADAVGKLLNRPVREAWLVFLCARRLERVI